MFPKDYLLLKKWYAKFIVLWWKQNTKKIEEMDNKLQILKSYRKLKFNQDVGEFYDWTNHFRQSRNIHIEDDVFSKKNSRHAYKMHEA